MKRKSSLIGVAALALLVTSGLPVAAGKPASTMYELHVTCLDSSGATWMVPDGVTFASKSWARAYLRDFVKVNMCVKSTVEYSITEVPF